MCIHVTLLLFCPRSSHKLSVQVATTYIEYTRHSSLHSVTAALRQHSTTKWFVKLSHCATDKLNSSTSSRLNTLLLILVIPWWRTCLGLVYIVVLQQWFSSQYSWAETSAWYSRSNAWAIRHDAPRCEIIQHVTCITCVLVWVVARMITASYCAVPCSCWWTVHCLTSMCSDTH
jgi:hypothetical protein